MVESYLICSANLRALPLLDMASAKNFISLEISREVVHGVGIKGNLCAFLTSGCFLSISRMRFVICMVPERLSSLG